MSRTTKSPCLGCSVRHKLCHNTCEEYKGYKDALDHIKAERHKTDVIDEYISEQSYKHSRYKSNKHKR